MVPPKINPRLCLKTLVFAVLSDKNLHLPEHSFFKPLSTTATCNQALCLHKGISSRKLFGNWKKLKKKTLKKQGFGGTWGGGGQPSCPSESLVFQLFFSFYQFFSLVFSFITPLVFSEYSLVLPWCPSKETWEVKQIELESIPLVFPLHSPSIGECSFNISLVFLEYFPSIALVFL